ncbi:Dihydrolipoyllysine-residue acetyltransferase component of pyruvate dehydrogenase complex [bacterium HR40]|nr:Dihydrolipoyllysine-residue acetyltransferase component of pyruvate dehydrogenase complex [bacterium HR40]
MPIEIRMPALSPTMTEGTLARWLKREGETVRSGEVIAEIETDKTTMEFEAVDEGVLGKILVPEGTAGVKVGEPIAILLAEGEEASALGAASTGTQAIAPTAPAAADTAAVSAAGAAAPSSQPASRGAESARIFASPLARRMAEQAGLDLRTLRGSGPHGRIVRADVERALAERQAWVGAERPAVAPAVSPAVPTPAAPAPAAAAAAPSVPGPSATLLQPIPGMAYEEVPLSSMRRVIARRLTEAKQQIPHFYLTIDCELDALLELRKRLNERPGADYRLSVNDFVIRAVALAIRKKPDVNASFGGERIYRYRSIDIAVAVATPGGLITPIVREADRKGLAAISREMRELAERARAGKLKPEEYQGGSFSVSNLGMYGIREFAAVINPPQACILAVGAGEPRAVVKNGALAIATLMTCTLSVDHRVVDGALAAEFLQEFKKLVEDPLALLV